MCITGGGFKDLTMGSIKRKFDEIITKCPVKMVTLDRVRSKSIPISFYQEELPGGLANTQILLLIRAELSNSNFDVRRILVDEGSSVDIMYAHLFRTLHFGESNLYPYVGSDL